MIRLEFVPPKPNEFDKNTSIFLFVAFVMIFRLAECSSGVSKLIFGAMKEFSIIGMEYTISLAPAIQHSCPVMDFVELTGVLASPNTSLIACASLASPEGDEVACALI